MSARLRLFARRLRHPLSLAILSLLTITGSSWFADILKGDCLELHGWRRCGEGLDGPGLALALALFFFGMAGIWHAARHYLPVRQLRAGPRRTGCKALILLLSSLTPGVVIANAGQIVRKGETAVTVAGDLDGLIEALDPLKCNTQQLLRAIRPHAGTLSRIILLGTPGAQGSARLRADYRALLARLLPQAHIDTETPPVDFEELEALEELLEDCCGRLLRDDGIAEGEIVIDITGGQKTASIAAALATLHRPQLAFQYVQTQPPHEIKTYNVVSLLPPRLEI